MRAAKNERGWYMVADVLIHDAKPRAMTQTIGRSSVVVPGF
jgi:hypothetical protein